MDALQISYSVALVPPVLCGVAAYVLEWDEFPAWAGLIVTLGVRLFGIVLFLHIWLTVIFVMLQR